MAKKLGNLTDQDLADVDSINERMIKVSECARERNCLLYIDAEQTYLQNALDSFTQQMAFKLNRDDRVVILNTYQNYLKRMVYTVPMEIEASKFFGFNLGIKFVRGAYMMEEREIAQKDNVASPIWDEIEGTHKCYNGNVEYAIKHMNN